MAVKYNIPLILWGDHGLSEQGGMNSINDFVEYTDKYRIEHDQHGFEWYDFINIEDEKLTEKDLKLFIYQRKIIYEKLE